ncbi:hypothetical protein D8674_005517 [Pyrus ussuriensis x Pyrus communis]|uniref:Uncharacterized protein n=1 Tax=Pyrus ussuriensis x Pyrus communis TaxID=2448454 RepID=A0A5N5FWP3_9ROSA|nr:hypothetical protein D8674_005517 [Pyrus ussuriensis x Pyrus communis]
MSPEKFKVKLDLRTMMNMVVSSHYIESYKAEQLVDKSIGQLGYTQEGKFTSTKKYVDKVLGFTA